MEKKLTEIPSEIQLEFQFNTNGSQFEIDMIFNRNFNNIPIEIDLKSSWNFNEKNWNFTEFNRIVNELTMEISIKDRWNSNQIQKKFQWNTNGNPVEILMQYLS